MAEIECVSDENQFLSLRPEWTELWEDSLTQSFFLTHDWIRCCWKELQLRNQLRVFVLREGGKAVLIAPFMKSRRAQRGIPADCLTLIEHPEAQSADIMVAQSHADSEHFLRLLRFLIEQQGTDWHVLLLDKLSEQSITLQLLTTAAEAAFSHFEIRPSHQALFIPLVGGWEGYLNSRSRRFRKTLRNVENRIERLGTLIVNCYSGSQCGYGVIQKMFSVSDLSWKIADGIAMTSQRSRMTFFEDLISLHREDVRVWLLEVNGTPIASEIQVVDGLTVYALRSDYDERYADSSPGVYLQVEILKRLFCSPYRQYNLGVGINPYKTRWADERFSLMNLRIYNRTIYSRFLRSIEQCNGHLKRMPGVRTLHDFIVGRA